MQRRTAVIIGTIGLFVGAARAHAGFGDPLPGLTATESAAFLAGKTTFARKETVATGLGPVFNDVSCGACHRKPRLGGGGTIVERRIGTTGMAGFDPLVDVGGPGLQTKGIGLVGACTYQGETIPAAATIVAPRRTTPVFGFGLVDVVPDATLEALALSQQTNTPTTAGRPNHVLDAPSGLLRVGRFGWKAQTATLAHFSGEAYLTETGITSPSFPDEICPQGDCTALACDPVPDPEDDGTDVVRFVDFMTLLGPLPTHTLNPRTIAGGVLFAAIGCAACHTPDLTTGPSAVAALDQVTFHPYSDFLLHDMGALGDGITQGEATGTEMRTAPLWGVRKQKKALLHDGRARNVAEAIVLHDGQGAAARDAYLTLPAKDQRAVVAFVKTL